MRQITARTTLRDVARLAGISVNSASKVLNNTRSGAHVSEQTRKRILDAAKELGYLPNTAAQSLVSRRSNIICLYFDAYLVTISPFSTELIGGAEKGCQNVHQSLLLYSRREGQTTDEICRDLLSGMIDGIVMPGWTSPELIVRLRDSHLPVVHFPTPHPDFPSVVVDEISAARQAVEYLCAKDYQSIVYRGFPEPDIDSHRYLRYKLAAGEAGLDFSTIRAADSMGNIGDEDRALLALPKGRRPSAVVCWNDEFAYRFLNYCDDVGISVPGDIAVVGFDGAHTFPQPRRRLTTVYVPWSDTAQTAVGLVADIRDGKPVPEQTVLPVRLIVGDTA